MVAFQIGGEQLDLLEGAEVCLSIYGGAAFLHWLYPGAHVIGYACDRDGKPLRYKLNGLPVLVSMVSIWYFLGYNGYVHLETIAQRFWSTLFVTNLVGLSGAAFFLWRGLHLEGHLQEKYLRCATADSPHKKQATQSDVAMFDARSILGHFYLGLEFNPRWGLFDVKMFCYLAGATLLELNLLSAAALSYKETGTVSIAMAVYIWCFSWFCCEYMFFEKPHLYTYDIFAERLGFKLFWGCFTFYPNFYCVGVWSLIHPDISSKDLSPAQAAGCVALFYLGWVFTRGPNMQKFWFKCDPTLKTCFNGLVQYRTIPGSKILCSGFWGLSRHINYFGEIMQAIALSLPGYLVSGSWTPFLYVAYYVFLFVPRQIDDDAVCLQRYGKKWEAYEQTVPSRIIPLLY